MSFNPFEQGLAVLDDSSDTVEQPKADAPQFDPFKQGLAVSDEAPKVDPDESTPWEELSPEKKAEFQRKLEAQIGTLNPQGDAKKKQEREAERADIAVGDIETRGAEQSAENLALQEHIIPLKGSKAALKEGLHHGEQLLGKNAAGKTIGAVLGGTYAAGTAFNPIMYGGQKLAAAAQAAPEFAFGEFEKAMQTIEGSREILPELQPTVSESTWKNFFSDLYAMARKDPVNTVMITEGLGRLGVNGFAARMGAMGKPLPEVLLKHFPETQKIYEGTARKTQADPSPIKEPPAAEYPDTPIPEKPQTVTSQMEWLKDGKRDAVFLPTGTAEIEVPTGMETLEVPGRGKYVFNPEKLSTETILKAEAENKVGDLLGYGIDEKPKTPTDAVVVRGPDGVEKQSVVTDAQNLPKVKEAAEKVADPGDAVTVEPPEKVISERMETGLAPEEQLRLEKEARAEMEKSLREELGQKEELLDAVMKEGGIPTPKVESTATGLKGEIQMLREAANKSPRWFRKTAKNLDQLSEALRARGFDFETPADLATALYDRLNQGVKMYAGSAIRDEVFASTAKPKEEGFVVPPQSMESMRKLKEQQKFKSAAEVEKPKDTGTREMFPQEGEQTDLFGTKGTASKIPIVRAPQPTTVPELKSRSQIIRDLAKGLDIPIRFGRLAGSGGGASRFGGYFKTVSNLIGSRFANDIPVVAHEVGHKLDQMFKISDNSALSKELSYLGDNLRPDSRSSWTPSKTMKYKRAEGLAEFVRYWLVEPAEAQRIAPELSKHFEAVLNGSDDVANVMRTAQKDIQTWRNSPERARFRSQFVSDNPVKKPFSLRQLQSDFIDDLHVLSVARDEAVKNRGRALPPSKDPYLLARLMRGDDGTARTFLQRGVVDFKTKDVTGKGLEQILEPIRKQIDDFTDYVAARRAKELQKRGIETGLDPVDVDATLVELDSPEFQKVAEELYQWQDSVLQYSVDAGSVTPEGAAAMREMNRNYVPFKRLYEVGAGELPEQGGGTGRGLAQGGKPGSVKKIRGSAREIINPIESIVGNTYVMVRAAEKAAVMRAVTDLERQPGMGKWIERVARPVEMRSTTMEQVAAQLRDAGADLKKADFDSVLSFFEPSTQAPYGENTIRVFKNGKPEFYRLDGDLFRTLTAMDVEDVPKVVKMASGFAQALRGGATLYPDFTVSNMVRDTISSGIVARKGFIPFYTSLKGLKSLLGKDEMFDSWRASGGEHAVEPIYFDREKLQGFIKEKLSKDVSAADRALFFMKSPLLALRFLSGMSEQATRVGYFEKAYKKAISEGMNVADARRLAAFESRDLLDFGKRGARMKALNMMTAFLNSQVQGLERLRLSFKEDPFGTSVRAGAYITLPTTILYAINRDDPEYWDRPQWERDLFWLIPFETNGKRRFIRLPKPFELGVIFGTMPERIMAQIDEKDPDAMDGIASRLVSNTIPKPLPTAVMPFLESVANYSLYQGRQIVPDRLEDAPPELQFTEQTSLTAKKIGKLLGYSPMKIDALIAGYTSSLGRFATLDVADPLLEKATGEKSTARKMVPFGRFVTTPSGTQSEAVNRFYSELETLRQEKQLVESGEEPKADLRLLKTMERAADDLGELRRLYKSLTDEDAKLEIAILMREVAKGATPTDGEFPGIPADKLLELRKALASAKRLERMEQLKKKGLVRKAAADYRAAND